MTLIAATTVMGNVDIEHTTENTLAILELCGYEDVEVARGASRPLVRDHLAFPVVHGERGLGRAELPPATQGPSGRDAAHLIVETARERPGEVLPGRDRSAHNVALALAEEPSLPALLRGFTHHGRSVRVSGQRDAGRGGEHLGGPRGRGGRVPRVRRSDRGEAAGRRRDWM